MGFSSEEVETFLQVARDATLGATYGERLDAVTGPLSVLIPNTSLSAMVIEPQAGAAPPAHHTFLRNNSVEHLQTYAEHYMSVDPMRDAIPRADGMAHVLSNFAPGRRFGRDAFTGEFLPRHGIRHLMACSLRMPDRGLLLIGIHRDRGLKDFSSREREILRLTSPDLARAAFGAILREKVAALAEANENGVAAEATSGAMIFNGVGDLVRADRGALALVDRAVRSEGFPADLFLADVKRIAFARAAEGLVVERTIPLEGGGWLRIRFSPLTSRRGGNVLAVLERLRPGTREHLTALADRAGLTARERQIAELVVHGMSNGEIGHLLGCKTTTVAIHLTHVFKKLDVPGRSELTALLLGAPWVAPRRS